MKYRVPPLIQVVASHSRETSAAISKLSNRLAALEHLDSAPYRTRVRKLFGRVLPPEEVVNRIVRDVREKGDHELFGYARSIDGVRLSHSNVRISEAERKAAFRRTSKDVRAALELAAERIRDYQQRLMPHDVALHAAKHGPADVRMGLHWSPLRRVGVYVPGGTAAYPSSVLMNAIPAQVAGVKEIAIVTPCDQRGAVSDGVLAACEIIGAREIYRLGGAQAVAALAYGTKSVPAVEKIVGPGNLFVMLAKRAVFGRVDIDMLAGPSEVLVIADASAPPAFIAADLLAQAEHDVLASCILLTNSAKLAAAVQRELAAQLETLPRRQIASAALRDWGLIVVCRNLDEAVALGNELAPEHLEIMTRNASRYVKQLTTAGAIFVGPHAAEPLGDYLAGPSHTLPTGGTACAFSGLSVYSFLRRTSVIEAGRRGLARLSGAICTLAEAEGLEAHKRAVEARIRIQTTKSTKETKNR